ncbi:protein of unknown function [Pseudobutyrivibrio sp. YE44]|uniref:DUF4317 domain-containing protein n=1 Tax=Pseudobutyrivibrio sp. YE44 TaxID=1520802 RepID=UPI00088FE955|nr:DUF4317 domain-containing protein [Pseudobutyrivibrio sp. YE44]SDB48476.1 protein of unknown function [Pseudobutyrivibrio sp. YE44]
MNKKEINEIKRRFKKDSCNFDKMVGCYVDANKEMVLTFKETFLNLEDEEFHKYLEIANKALSGTVGNNLLELPFDPEREIEGSGHDLLMKLRETRLQDEKLLIEYYNRIIESYDFVGNYLILLYHDTYDIPVKTTDDLKLDESEEVYDYIICAICPVALSKPGLGYREAENRIGARDRDWVVGPVDTAFTFPCFSERTTDLHACLAYTKNTKEPHVEFWENCIECGSKKTTTQKKNAFNNILDQALGEETDETIETKLDIQQNLSDFITVEKERLGEEETIVLEPQDVANILTDSGLSDIKVEKIQAKFENYFEEQLPLAEEILDEKALKNNELRVEKNVLKERVVDLTKQLKEVNGVTEDGKQADIVVKVSDTKAADVTTAFVDGKKCVCVPIEPDEIFMLNGEQI